MLQWIQHFTFTKDMKFAGGSGRGEVLWLLSYGEEVEGRTSSFLERSVVLCVWKIAYEPTRFRVLVILFPYLSTAYEQIRALQTRGVTEQTVQPAVRSWWRWWTYLLISTNVSRDSSETVVTITYKTTWRHNQGHHNRFLKLLYIL
jgi:hypothetical protein